MEAKPVRRLVIWFLTTFSPTSSLPTNRHAIAPVLTHDHFDAAYSSRSVSDFLEDRRDLIVADAGPC